MIWDVLSYRFCGLHKEETVWQTKNTKSDVFSMLLQDKKRAMEIYNAINGTDYDDPELVEMTTFG